MKTFRVKISMEVEVESFDDNDALDAVNDSFGIGEVCGLLITDFEITDYEQLPV